MKDDELLAIVANTWVPTDGAGSGHRLGEMAALAVVTVLSQRMRGPVITADDEERCEFTQSGKRCLYNSGHDAHLVDALGGRSVVVPMWAEWPDYHKEGS